MRFASLLAHWSAIQRTKEVPQARTDDGTTEDSHVDFLNLIVDNFFFLYK